MTEPLYRIAPLKWEPYRDFPDYFIAYAIDDNYEVRRWREQWHWAIQGQPMTESASLESAKAACQSHWEQTLSKYLEKVDTVTKPIETATALMHQKIAELQADIECFEGMKDGVAVRIADLEKANKILELKTQNRLANNLCPDHRDKQRGKCCLACRIETLEKQVDELQSQLAEREPWDHEANQDCVGNGGITCPHCGHVE